MSVAVVLRALLGATIAGVLFAFLGPHDRGPNVAGGVLFGAIMFAVLVLTGPALAPLRQRAMRRPWLAQLLVGLVILAAVVTLIAAMMLSS
jgi:hypothetical protein